jgi:hypothetical protein
VVGKAGVYGVYLDSPANAVAVSTSAGSNPGVSIGPVNAAAVPAVIFGTVVNNGTATLTPVYAIVNTATTYSFVGSLSGSGFWQGAVAIFPATGSGS